MDDKETEELKARIIANMNKQTAANIDPKEVREKVEQLLRTPEKLNTIEAEEPKTMNNGFDYTDEENLPHRIK